MCDTVENLILDLVEWLGPGGRTYEETMEAWRTSCPRLPVWEDANDRGYVERLFTDGRATVRATEAGLRLLQKKRPDCYERLRRRMKMSMKGVSN